MTKTVFDGVSRSVLGGIKNTVIQDIFLKSSAEGPLGWPVEVWRVAAGGVSTNPRTNKSYFPGRRSQVSGEDIQELNEEALKASEREGPLAGEVGAASQEVLGDEIHSPSHLLIIFISSRFLIEQ